MKQSRSAPLLPLLGDLWRSRAVIGRIIAFLTAVVAAYYSTVYGIRLTINEKADRQVVSQIDQRLIVIETILRTDVATRADLTALREVVQQRLTRIETLLEPQEQDRR